MTTQPQTTLAVQLLNKAAKLPTRAHDTDAGIDLHACLISPIVLAPGERAVIPTGIAIALPHGTAGFVHPRSGLAAKHGITVCNAPGTIDEAYRGEVGVCLINLGNTEVTITHHMRIAQLIVQDVHTPRIKTVDVLEDTDRGEGGWGSTGQ